MIRAAVVVLLLCLPVAAPAQEEHELAAKRALIERDQQSAEFALRLRQSQSGTRGDAAEMAELEALYADQRRRQEALHQDQLRRLSEAAAQGRPEADREALARERRLQAQQFEAERRWGPVLDESGNGTPRRRWTPTLIP